MVPAPGQVWAEPSGRTLRLDRIDGGRAVLTVLANAAETQQYLDEAYQYGSRSVDPAPPGWHPSDQRGKVTRIALRRLVGPAYRLPDDAD